MIIYIVRNILNGSCYIGQTRKSLRERWKQHQNDMGKGSRLYFHAAMRRYGVSAFSPEVLCECTEQEAHELERFCITVFRTKRPEGYNMTDGGDGVSGYVFTLRDLKKIASINQAKAKDPEFRRKLLVAAESSLWKDISGIRYTKLIPLEVIRHKRAQDGSLVWKCQCDCGNVCEVSANDLNNENTTSCGCVLRKMEDKAALMKAKKGGQSLAEIAETLGISSEAVKARLQRLGEGTPFGDLLKVRESQFWELANQKKSSREIAQTLGISQTSVRARYRRKGISIKEWRQTVKSSPSPYILPQVT